MTQLRSYARLTFKTKSKKDLLVLDSNADVLAVTTHKEISNPNGTFSILLSPRIAKEYATQGGSLSISNIVTPYDLVQIEFKTDDEYKVEMIGLVSRASVSMNLDQSGTPQRVLKIDGFDMGMILKNFYLFFSPFLVGDSLQAFGGNIVFGTDNRIFKGNNPKQFIENFVNYAVGKPFPTGPTQVFYPLTLPNNLKLTDYMDLDTGIGTAFTNFSINDPFILTNIGAGNEVSVYDICKFYSDQPFHEVFMDLRRPDDNADSDSVALAEATHSIDPPSSTITTLNSSGERVTITNNNQPYVFVMRTTPFSQGSGSWDGLNTHDFLITDVMKQDVATSEKNVFNYYDLVCERQSFALGDKQKAYVADKGRSGGIIRFPIQDQTSIDRFGFKKFPDTTTKYVEFVSAVNTNKKTSSDPRLTNFLPLKQVLTLTRQLYRWYSFGELFECGTIVLKGRVGVGRKGVTMGSRLRECTPDGSLTGKEYYIEAVMQEFTLGSPLQTTVSVTRGCNQVQRFTQMKQAEKGLNLDQANNGTYFFPIDAEDFQ